MVRFLKAHVTWAWVETRHGLLPAPRIEMPIRFAEGEGKYGLEMQCQWDSGSQLSVMSETFARGLGIDLDREPDTAIRGVTGNERPAWRVERFVRFPGLDGLRFRFHFLVLQGSDDPLPLVGMLDTFGNFELIQHGATFYFFLKDGHRGEPL
jgi:hypothetical protein